MSRESSNRVGNPLSNLLHRLDQFRQRAESLDRYCKAVKGRNPQEIRWARAEFQALVHLHLLSKR